MDLTPIQQKILLIFVGFYNTHEIAPVNQFIADTLRDTGTNLSKEGVGYQMKQLCKKGYLKKIEYATRNKYKPTEIAHRVARF